MRDQFPHVLLAAVLERGAAVLAAEGGGKFALVEIARAVRDLDDRKARPGKKLCGQLHPQPERVAADALAEDAGKIVFDARLADGKALGKFPRGVRLCRVKGNGRFDLLCDFDLRLRVIDGLGAFFGGALEKKRKKIQDRRLKRDDRALRAAARAPRGAGIWRDMFRQPDNRFFAAAKDRARKAQKPARSRRPRSRGR